MQVDTTKLTKKQRKQLAKEAKRAKKAETRAARGKYADEPVCDELMGLWLLSSYELADWFFDRDVVPGQSNTITHTDYVSLMFDATELGILFHNFVKQVIISAGFHEYVFNIDTWEELHNDYCRFIAKLQTK